MRRARATWLQHWCTTALPHERVGGAPWARVIACACAAVWRGDYRREPSLRRCLARRVPTAMVTPAPATLPLRAPPIRQLHPESAEVRAPPEVPVPAAEPPAADALLDREPPLPPLPAPVVVATSMVPPPPGAPPLDWLDSVLPPDPTAPPVPVLEPGAPPLAMPPEALLPPVLPPPVPVVCWAPPAPAPPP
jgi:hypothetical protein